MRQQNATHAYSKYRSKNDTIQALPSGGQIMYSYIVR